ncbi:zeta-sarcoglycan isoform X1 [Vespa crabro]|uniref:zeta-sarcoglycan isoform X1 n=2 Tax=Vespa crabro TaxID=7445 RepID=UPI001F013416|nr:zeta-sarcoglycan isoform X1 [Vespa crabro]XP_046835873.1 zeta-sarcoglycan isoform X1 [Vespa crabro]XP_046835874.1 zeta-sarcoglycan isoform X1 [Vespa crabro]
MDTSPTLSIGGSRARAALLTTTGTGSGGTDRRVVFLTSQTVDGNGHETKTWPHHWSPHTPGKRYKSPEDSPRSEQSKVRMSRNQSGWSEEAGSSEGVQRRSGTRQTLGTTQSLKTSSAVLEDRTSSAATCKGGFRLGIYGWRKRCLYSLVLTLMVIVILNLALTVWLLKVMGFTSEGIGSLKVVPGGIELRGQAAILDALVASSLRSRRGKNLVLESWSNFTATARSHDGRLLAKLTVGEDRVDCISRSFRITDPRGGVIFSANREQVLVGADMLKVTGDGGAVFQGSVQTPLVRGESGRGLRLESATRSLKISAPQRVVLESWANEISASCLTDLKLQSIHGAIKLDSKSVFLKGLKTAVTVQGRSSREQQQQQPEQEQQQQQQQQQPQQQQQQQQQRSSRSSTHQNQRETSIYQLCACANGKLFLARPEGICQADKSVC